MIRFASAALVLLCTLRASAQGAGARFDDLHLQFHGYATQGFVYTTNNNWNLTDSTSGSFQWTDAVLSVSSEPRPKLRIGAQARYFWLGGIQNKVTLDWAQADFKLNEYIGFRGGKVKTPIGLLNESQDIDPAQTWVLLPQSVYPIASRNVLLAHYGGVVYGSVRLGERFGKLEYRGFGGQRSVPGDDGYLQSLRDQGFQFPSGASGHAAGATLRWNAPMRGLVLGASESSGSLNGSLLLGPYSGSLNLAKYRQTFFFGRYERGRFMIAGEDFRQIAAPTITVAGYTQPYRSDDRAFYVMSTYKPAAPLTVGLYYSSYLDRQGAFTSFRYQKDWALAARYDFNSYLYAKLEQHFVDGNAIGISTTDNTNLQPNNRMTLLKVGVSF